MKITSFFNIFTRAKANPKAESRPENIRDYRPSSSSIINKDSTSFAVIDRIASEVAMLSYGVYNSRTKTKLDKHPIYDLLKRPNLEETHFNFFYQSAVDYYNGGIYWKIARDSFNQVISLFRLNPAQITMTRESGTNQRLFAYNGQRYTDKDIVYIPSRFDYSTLYGGLSIFKSASGAFDTANKLDTYTNASFDKGINGKRLVIDISNALPDATENQINDLRAKYEETYSGATNAGKPLFKKKGIEYSEIGNQTDNKSAALIENRQFQEHEIAKLFGFPTDLLDGTATSKDLENLFVLLAEFAVKPLATQIQEAINLLIEDNSYFEFNYNGMLKVSLSRRVDAYVKQINNGLLSTNEARAKENMSPTEAGDTFFIPANLMPLNDETINAYMAKQKMTAQGLKDSDQHSPTGDDKQ